LKRYIELGADVVLGTATIVDPWTVNVIDENSNLSKYSARPLFLLVHHLMFLKNFAALITNFRPLIQYGIGLINVI